MIVDKLAAHGSPRMIHFTEAEERDEAVERLLLCEPEGTEAFVVMPRRDKCSFREDRGWGCYQCGVYGYAVVDTWAKKRSKK